MHVKNLHYTGCSFIMGLLAGADDITAAQRLMKLPILQLSVLPSPTQSQVKKNSPYNELTPVATYFIIFCFKSRNIKTETSNGIKLLLPKYRNK